MRVHVLDRVLVAPAPTEDLRGLRGDDQLPVGSDDRVVDGSVRRFPGFEHRPADLGRAGEVEVVLAVVDEDRHRPVGDAVVAVPAEDVVLGQIVDLAEVQRAGIQRGLDVGMVHLQALVDRIAGRALSRERVGPIRGHGIHLRPRAEPRLVPVLAVVVGVRTVDAEVRAGTLGDARVLLGLAQTQLVGEERVLDPGLTDLFEPAVLQAEQSLRDRGVIAIDIPVGLAGAQVADVGPEAVRGDVADRAEASGVRDLGQHEVRRFARHVACVGVLRLRHAAGQNDGSAHDRARSVNDLVAHGAPKVFGRYDCCERTGRRSPGQGPHAQRRRSLRTQGQRLAARARRENPTHRRFARSIEATRRLASNGWMSLSIAHLDGQLQKRPLP